MELRKTLCHPYLVQDALEHENVSDAEMHQRLIEGSSKLTLLSESRLAIFVDRKLNLPQ